MKDEHYKDKTRPRGRTINNWHHKQSQYYQDKNTMPDKEHY
jgi:hypothetical protein